MNQIRLYLALSALTLFACGDITLVGTPAGEGDDPAEQENPSSRHGWCFSALQVLSTPPGGARARPTFNGFGSLDSARSTGRASSSVWRAQRCSLESTRDTRILPISEWEPHSKAPSGGDLKSRVHTCA